MAKKKPSKKNDQPELPLDAAPEAPAASQKPETGNLKPEGSKPSASTGTDTPQVSGFRSQVSDGAAPPAESAPKRKKGEKVQDEQAPMAIS